MGIMASIGFCDHLKSLGSIAGCGKPHVRWCGRGDGRNPVTSSRSVLSCCGFDGFLGCFCLFVLDYRDLGIAPTAVCAEFDRRVLARRFESTDQNRGATPCKALLFPNKVKVVIQKRGQVTFQRD